MTGGQGLPSVQDANRASEEVVDNQAHRYGRWQIEGDGRGGVERVGPVAVQRNVAGVSAACSETAVETWFGEPGVGVSTV